MNARPFLAFAAVVLTCAAQRTARAQGSLDPIRVSGVVHAPVEEVWKAWTTNEGLQAFLVEGSDVELKPGGPYEIYFSMSAPEGSRGSETCKVLSYLPQQMLSFEWNAPPKFEHARFRHTWVVLNFESLGAERTRVELTHLGFAEHAAEHPDHEAEWKEVRAYFTNAWPYVMNALVEHFASEDATLSTDPQRALDLATRLVGGEWVLEHQTPSGQNFYARNIIRGAPDGKALVADGWLGSDQGMTPHAATQMWIDTETNLLVFQSLTEGVAVMRGHLETLGDDTLIEHITLSSPDGPDRHFKATLIFTGPDTYDMILQRGDTPPGEPMSFRRVDKAPEKLRTLTDGTILD